MNESPPIAAAVGGPTPTPDEHSRPFWAALADRRILLQRCATCARRRFPRMPTCPYCGAVGGDDDESPGTGTVYSFVRIHRAMTSAYTAVVPYAIATVDLDGGGRMFGRVVPSDACAIGVRVIPDFVDHRDGGADWTELVFRIEPAVSSS